MAKTVKNAVLGHFKGQKRRFNLLKLPPPEKKSSFCCGDGWRGAQPRVKRIFFPTNEVRLKKNPSGLQKSHVHTCSIMHQEGISNFWAKDDN